MKKHFTSIIFSLLILAFVPFCGVKAQQVLEITGDGSDATHDMIPVCGMWFSELQKSQIIYPATKLTALQGKKITKITFFTNQGNNYNWKNNIHIRMASTTQNDLETGWFIGSKTEVFLGKLLINSSNELNIVLNTPFFYTGDNLLIEFDLSNNMNFGNEDVYFQGTTEATYISRQVSGSIEYNGVGTAFDFLPKMRVEYTDETCPPLSEFSTIVNHDNTVTLNWTNPPQNFWSPEATNLTFKFFNETNQIGESNDSYLTSWTSDVFTMGSTNNFSASISYYDNNQTLMCESYPIKKTATIPCLPASNLTTTVINENDVMLTWEEPKIPTEILLSENFTSGMPTNWTLIDVNGNDQNWCIGTNGYNSANCASSYSSYPYPNNYLITPELASNATKLKYWVRKDNEIYDDKYAVMVSSTGNSISDFTILFEEELTTTGWKQRNINLPLGTKYIAFQHNAESVGGVHIDDIIVHTDALVPITDPHTFTITRNDVEIASELTELTYIDSNLSGNIYDYCVEVVYQNCTSNPICSQIFVEDIARPPARNLSTTTNNYDVSLTWDPPLNVLLLESFESGTLPEGWLAVDHDSDGYNWHLDTYNGGYNSGYNSYNYMSSESIIESNYDPLYPDNYLITPLVESATNIQYWVRFGSYNEHYAIMISTTDNNIASFTDIIFEESTSISGTWLQRNINLPEGTKYIAFRHFNSTNNWDINIDEVVIYGNQPVTEDYTYTITRYDTEIASGLTETTYTATDGSYGSYDYCVKVVYDNATSDPICETIIIDELPCNPVKNLSSIVNDNNVKLIWDTPDDLQVLILSEDFESGIPSDWDLIDADSDGNNWYLDTYTGHNSNNCVSSESYDYNNSEALSPDNYLISPLLNNASKVEYWVYAVEDTPYEHYAIMASTTGKNISDFTSVYEETMTNSNHWYKRSINLPPETKYIAFRHYNCTNQKGLKIDDINIYNISPTTQPHTYTITRNGEEIASGLTDNAYEDLNLDFSLYSYYVEVIYEYCTNTSYIEITIEEEENICPPVTNLSITTDYNNVYLSWDAPDVLQEIGILLNENFEFGIPSDWTFIDADGDTYNWAKSTNYPAHSGNSVVVSYSKYFGSALEPDNYLITPLVDGATNLQYYFAVNATYPTEHYAVMVSTTGIEIEDFETIFEETATSTSDWTKRNIELPEGTKYIAFRHYNSTNQNYILLDDITVHGIANINYTYTITREFDEIASGLTETTYTDYTNIDLDYNHYYTYCVKAVSEDCISYIVCENIAIINYCASVNDLNATVNEDNTVNLNWTIPQQAEWPNNCTEDIAFKIYDGPTQIGYSDVNNLTSWTTNELSNGTHYFKVVIFYYNNNSELICSAEAYASVTIDGGFDCPPVNFLSATVNEDNTVTLYWTLPEEFPAGCDGNIALKFLHGNTNIGYIYNSNLTSWTTPVLPGGTQLLTIIIYYFDNSNIEICFAETLIGVTIEDSTICLPVTDLSATVNPDNTVTLNWTTPPSSTWPVGCEGELSFQFFNGASLLDFFSADDLTSWTTGVLANGTHTLKVIILYYNSDVNYYICSAESSITVTITNSFACLPVNNLSATVNDDYTANLNWTLPEELPPGCNGNLAFKFYYENYEIGSDDNDYLTSWTTSTLSDGTHTLAVVVHYYDDEDNEICFATNSVDITIDIYACPTITNLSATINEDNTVTLNWTLPEEFPTGCDGNLAFKFLHNNTNIGYSYDDDLTSWTTPVLPGGTQLLTIIIYYLNNSNIEICFAKTVIFITIEDSTTCLPVTDLSATVNPDNTVTLNWTTPPSNTWPVGCEGDFIFDFYNGPTLLDYNDADDLTSWTTNVLANGTHTIKVVINYYNSDSHYTICSPEASITVTITNSFACPPVNNLSATVNDDYTASLNWTLPEELPPGCNGNLKFKFYYENYAIGYDDNDYLTSWTTDVLTNGTHTLKVIIHYYDDEYNEICFAEASTSVTIVEATCPAITDLNATVNSDNTVDLSWNIPAETEWPNACTGNLAFHFYNGSTQIGYSNEDDLTSWTTGILPNGTHTLKVVIYYYDNSTNLICSAEASITITVNNSFICLPVNDLSAIANEDYTVNLIWTLPEELPTDCNGDISFKFYDGNTELSSDDSDNLTAWTTPALSIGTHTLAVVVYYYNDENEEICFAEASILVTIAETTCSAITDLNATVNTNNTVTLNWTNPPQSECPSDYPYYWFYNGETEIGTDNTDNLSSWTTPEFMPGTYSIGVQIGFYSPYAEDYICKADTSFVDVTITNIEEIKTSLFSAEIYPNPAKDLLTIKCDNEIISYELYDALGRLLINKSEVANNESIVNVSSLKHGIYILRLNTEKGSGTFKLIIDN